MAKNNRETICFKHCDFELYVSCEGLDAPRKKLAHTYTQRGLAQPVDEEITVLVDGQPVLIDTGDVLRRPFFLKTASIGLKWRFRIMLSLTLHWLAINIV
ncbi:hypothetical protein P4S54_04270 [Shewanella sp. PP-He15 brown]